jgi:transposase, IS6 family
MSCHHPDLFKWRHFQAEIILLCVRWYLRSALSYRDLEEIMWERGLQVDHTTIFRWVQRYAPELEKRCRPHLKACHDSWKVDETSIKIKKTWVYLYRAGDSDDQTLEFLLSPTRDAEAAKRFFLKALHRPACSTHPPCLAKEQVTQFIAATTLTFVPRTTCSVLTDFPSTTPVPRVINVDKNAAYPKAIAELKAAGILPQSVERRQIKDLNNLIEQDHRFIKRLTKPGMGFFSLKTAWRTIQGYEAMNMIRKGQLQGVRKGDIVGQVRWVTKIFGLVASV